jgi:hypothetical protein
MFSWQMQPEGFEAHQQRTFQYISATNRRSLSLILYRTMLTASILTTLCNDQPTAPIKQLVQIKGVQEQINHAILSYHGLP